MPVEIRTLEQLENDYWGEPPINSSSLIRTCYKLRKKNINEYEVEDLRIMINQNIGLRYLLPISVTILKKNPFIEAIYYEGDLLNSVLSCEPNFWVNHQDIKAEVSKIIRDNFDKIDMLDNTNETNDELKKLAANFIRE